MTLPVAEVASSLPALPIPGEWVVQGGAVGLLSLVVLMILVGQLVPRRTYAALEKERDYWRQVALQAMGQADLLLPAATLATEVTRVLSDVAAQPAQPATQSPGGRTT